MKTEFKDVAHLYLGCEFKTAVFDGGIFEIDGVTKSEVERDEVIIISGGSEFYATETQPILRPLSDMTEQEFIELFKLCSLFDLSDCTFEFGDSERFINAEFNGRIVDCIQIVSGDCVMMMNNDRTFSPVNPQSQCFLFFLSKHFDLFGLIKSGQAIDATTLKANP